MQAARVARVEERRERRRDGHQPVGVAAGKSGGQAEQRVHAASPWIEHAVVIDLEDALRVRDLGGDFEVVLPVGQQGIALARHHLPRQLGGVGPVLGREVDLGEQRQCRPAGHSPATSLRSQGISRLVDRIPPGNDQEKPPQVIAVGNFRMRAENALSIT